MRRFRMRSYRDQSMQKPARKQGRYAQCRVYRPYSRVGLREEFARERREKTRKEEQIYFAREKREKTRKRRTNLFLPANNANGRELNLYSRSLALFAGKI